MLMQGREHGLMLLMQRKEFGFMLLLVLEGVGEGAGECGACVIS